MIEKNQFGRLLIILLITAAVCLGLYWLPDELFGWSIRKVDMLSDLRTYPDEQLLTAEIPPLDDGPDSLLIADTLLHDTVRIHGFQVSELKQRDSTYRLLAAEASVAQSDTNYTRIEDYSIGHTGLHRFFTRLSRSHTLGRPVRIAFLGDSFIEGDILVADFRALMQSHFGGRGVGFVPISSVVEQYRPTAYQRSKGWRARSILSDHKRRYVLSGMLFEPEGSEATVTFKTVTTYPRLNRVSSLKFLYAANNGAEISLICNEKRDTFHATLPATETVAQYEADGDFTDGIVRLRNAAGLQALGVALEDNTGVVVDNFSLRGNSGIVVAQFDADRCAAFARVRPYDLIVLQYGLNVASEKVRDYGWYRDQMLKVVRHLQQCFPESDLLLLGVSDRSSFRNGAYGTMPAVVSLLHSQRRVAEQARIPFWSIYNAMGGENSMARYVKNNWASKDHTHLSFKGGKELANRLFDALLQEKQLYDRMGGGQ